MLIMIWWCVMLQAFMPGGERMIAVHAQAWQGQLNAHLELPAPAAGARMAGARMAGAPVNEAPDVRARIRAAQDALAALPERAPRPTRKRAALH